MIIVQDSEWILSEVGDGRFVFVNQKDRTVNMTVVRCRYILKQYNYALNLSFVDGVPRVEFTLKTVDRLTPSKASTEIENVLKYFRRTHVRNVELLYN